LVGKGGHIRTIPVPDWVYQLVKDWIGPAGIQAGKLFRKVSSAGKPNSSGTAICRRRRAGRITPESRATCSAQAERLCPELCPCRRPSARSLTQAVRTIPRFPSI
jgi:hypothetical protein